MDTLTLIAIGVIVVVIAYAVYAANKAGGRRTDALKVLAPQLGLTFVGDFAPTSAQAATGDPRDAFDALRATFGDFRRFQGSMHPRLFNWMRGEHDDGAVGVFDYHEPDNPRTTANTVTLAWFDRSSLTLPSFVLTPIPGRHVVPVATAAHAAISAIAAARHADVPVSIPTHPGFEDHYLLRGEDEAALKGVFTERVLGFFGDNPGWMIEGCGTRLLMNRLTADEVRAYWRGRHPPNDVREIAAGVSAFRDGTLGKQLMAMPGVPPEGLRSFLTDASAVAALFRTA